MLSSIIRTWYTHIMLNVALPDLFIMCCFEFLFSDRISMPDLHQVSIHKDKVADASAHDKEVEDFVAAKVLWKLIEDRKL